MVNTTISAERQVKFNAWCGTVGVNYLSEERGLSNLFKYAVPRLCEILDIETQIEPLLIRWIKEADILDDKETAMALFLAIERVI